MDLNKFEKCNIELGALGILGRKSRQIGFERTYTQGKRGRIEPTVSVSKVEVFNSLLFIK
jgi:hypothetical protein